MVLFPNKLPVLTVAGLCLCLMTAACGHGAEQRSASGGVGGALAGALVAGPVGAVVGATAGGVGGDATAKSNNEGR